MNNERYLVVTLKNQRNKIGVCILQDFNTVNQADLYSKYSIGDDIDTQLLKESGKEESKFLLLMPKQTQKAVKAVGKFSLEEGSLVTGTLKSIKGHCAFIQVGSVGKVPIIGRLQRIEMSTKLSEFDNLKPGDKVEAKILRKIEESGKTFIELTKRKEHMKLDEGLDKDL